MSAAPHALFTVFGVELEYMIVDAERLDVFPIADRLLATADGRPSSDFEDGPISWSNELTAHVVEFKTTDPAPTLDGLAEKFQTSLGRASSMLAKFGARLLPTAMHPWMDPARETRLWPQENAEIYEAFDRIFNCRGHGWANLQSCHLNLPFADDAEFARLHAAIRLVLPLLPALAASSPVMDGRATGKLDNRLEVYRSNAVRVPQAAGQVVPEPVFSEAEYQRVVLQPLYDAVAPLDPAGVLQEEWLNSRGAIARFTRGAIEIRVLDVQECPAADVAVLRLITAVLKSLAAERWTKAERQRQFQVEPLAALFRRSLVDAERTVVDDPDLLAQFGWSSGGSCTMQDLWRKLAEDHADELAPSKRQLDVLLEQGCLARRISQALGGKVDDREAQREVYGRLADCLAAGEMFTA